MASASPHSLTVASPRRETPGVVDALTKGGTWEIIMRIRKGVPSSRLASLARALGMPTGDFCTALRMRPATQERRIREGRVLPPHESDQLVRTAMVVARAIQVFGDRGKASVWMRQEVIALGGATPLSLLDTGIGADLVVRTLTAIEHGHPA